MQPSRNLDYAMSGESNRLPWVVKMATASTFTAGSLYIVGILSNDTSFVRHHGNLFAWLLVVFFAFSLLASVIALIKKVNRRPIAWISLGIAVAFWIIFVLGNIGGT